MAPFPLRTPFYRLCLLLALILALAACTPKKPSSDLSGKFQQDYEEVVQEPYVPRDDGLPLTPAELEAFNTKGVLDANLSQEDARIVELHFKYFVHDHRRTMERFIQRTARYLPYIKKVFNERGIPEEIAYLSMVESGGNPNAISPAGAVGLWQFMPYTGRKFGLEQTSWIDERRDPFKATYAASDYLLKLYTDFGDWHLAAAAYNAGEGKIGKAVEGTGATDFFELCRLDCNLEEKQRLKEETRQYVPRLLAVAKIMRNLKLLGFSEPSPADSYDFETVTVPPGTSLSGLARTLGLTWDEFSGMNPAFRRTASPPTGTSTAYVLPEKKREAEIWLASSEARIYADWREYRVRKGDTLSSISKRNRTSVADLRMANGFHSLPRPGSTIMIPGRSKEPVYAALPERDSAPTASAGKYTVAPGDTLYSLAAAWGTDVHSIRLANRLGSGDDKLSIGQRLSVPGNSKNRPAVRHAAGAQAAGHKAPQSSVQSASVPASSARDGDAARASSTYVVSSGDTLSGIALARDISMHALLTANGLDQKAVLKVGQTLRIPHAGAEAASAPAAKPADRAARPGTTQAARTTARQAEKPAPELPGKPLTVTVRKGDTLYSLSRKHNITVAALRQANGLGPNGGVNIGQKLRIPQ